MQINFEGLAKDAVSINRMKFVAELGKPIKLAYSGGKDSDLLLYLAKSSGVDFHAVYNWTTVDPPELLAYIRRDHPEVKIQMPKKSMWQLIKEYKMLPLRTVRYCCEDLKESTNKEDEIVLTGIRWAESVQRKKRSWLELSYKNQFRKICNPIIDWTTGEVWEYIHEKKIPYCQLYHEGFKRLGCVLCPMTTKYMVKIEMERWPKLALAWRHAAQRVIEVKGDKALFKSGDEYFEWWISREGMKKEDGQCVMFQ